MFFNYAVVVRGVGGLWERLDPRAEQAARALGASPWRAFRTVTLPALTPAIASAASLAFLFCATAFGTVLILGGLQFGTIETEIWVQTTQFLDLRAAAVLSVVQLVIVGLALTVAGRARARRERALALAEPDVRPLTLRRPAGSPRRDGHGLALSAAAVTAFVVLLLCLPLVNLVVRSLRVGDGWGIDHYAALGSTGGVLTVSVWTATLTSLRTALEATLLALLVGGLVALVVSRRPRAASGRRAVAGLDAVFMLPLGVSAVTVGFGFLLSMHEPFGLPIDLRTSGRARADRAGRRRRAARGADHAARAARDRSPAAPGRRDARCRARPGAAVGGPRARDPDDRPRRRLRVRGVARGVRRHVVPGTARRPDAAGADLPADRPARRRQLRHGPGRIRGARRAHRRDRRGVRAASGAWFWR